ncbi:MAG: hypothetical protein ABIK07_05655 [Planctomycetota bacterium]
MGRAVMPQILVVEDQMNLLRSINTGMPLDLLVEQEPIVPSSQQNRGKETGEFE